MDANTYTSWHLANMAEVASPDAHDGIGFDPPVETKTGSPGAEFLRRVAYDAAEMIEDGTTDDDSISERADGSVPVYTHDLWATFVDLAAYSEDISDYGESADMTKNASVALYMVAERLLRALIEANALDEDEDEDEEDEDAA